MMAVVTVELIPTGRRASRNDKREWAITDVYRVMTDDENDTQVEVLDGFSTETGIVIGTPFLDGLVAYAQSIEVEPGTDEDFIEWRATVQYGPLAYETPFDEPPQVEWQAESREVPLDIDTEGNLVVNSAYDPFDPTITIDRPIGKLTVTLNQAVFDWRWAYLFSNKINAQEFLGAEPRTVKMGQITFSVLYDTNVGWYRRVTYPLYFNPDGWDAEVVDLGRRRLASNVRKPILDNGVPVSEPVKLDGTGSVLDPDEPPVILTYRPLEAVNFNIYNLENILDYLVGGIF
jgi:hypothetical protein